MSTQPLVDFLTALWGDGPHSLCAASARRSFHTVAVLASPTELIRRAGALGPTSHIWFGVHPLVSTPVSGRGTELDVATVGALIADIDWDSPGAHKIDGLPPEAEVRAALARLGAELAPSIVVASGHGLQLYWLLDHALDADAGLELQARLSARLGELGLVNERNDLASVLRLPGSVNIKTTPVPVVIERIDLARRFTPEYLGRRLPIDVTVPARGVGTRHTAGPTTDDQLALLAHIVEHYGAHSPWFWADGSIEVVRPGKDHREGTSGSIITGQFGDAMLTVFSPNWPAIGPTPPAPSKSWVLTADGLQVAHAPTDPILLAGDDDDGEQEAPGPTPTPQPADPGAFFGKNGLRVVTLTRAVEAVGPLAMNIDGRLWRHRLGCWVDGGEREVARRVVQLLSERFRPSHLANVLAVFAAREPTLSHEQPEQWVNVHNGLLDWRTGQLAPHDPAVASTYQLTASWNAGATCPTVDAWLAEVVEVDVIPLVWEVIGMCVYGGEPFHRAVLLTGPGRNGKGTLLRLIKRLIGWRHVSAVTLQALGEDRFMAAELFGKVANLAGDLDARAVLRSDIFKMVTGGDTLAAQRKYGQPFTFANNATMLFAANEPPGSADHSLGYSSRWIVVPFRRITLAPGAEDKTLEGRMALELDGVLVSAIGGLRRALARGEYARPPSVEIETAWFRRAADPLRRFADDCLEITGMPHHDVARVAVYAAYREWCQAEGCRPLGGNRFWPALVEIDGRIDTGITIDNTHGHRHGQTKIVLGVEAINYVGRP